MSHLFPNSHDRRNRDTHADATQVSFALRLQAKACPSGPQNPTTPERPKRRELNPKVAKPFS